MRFAADIVDWGVLFEMIYSALAAGLGVALAFSLAVAGSTRFADEMRENRPTRAALYGVMAAFGLLVCLAAIVLGIVVMTAKD
jgi:cytochrome c biogenesis protein CcdA